MRIAPLASVGREEGNRWVLYYYKYRYLSPFAREKLGCLASSIPSKSFFSTGGIILSERRTRLDDGKAKILIFLNTYVKKLSYII